MRARDIAHKLICDEFKLNRGYVKRFLTQYLANHKRTTKRRKSSKSKKKKKAKGKQEKFFLQASDPDTSDLSPWESTSDDDDDPEPPRARKKSRVAMKTKKKTKSKKTKREKTKNTPTLPKVLESRMKESVDIVLVAATVSCSSTPLSFEVI
jgi:hypothetical protein